MRAYRTYLLDLADNIRAVIELDAPDDGDALAAARDLLRCHAAVEVWERARLVGRLGAEFAL